MAIKVTIFGDNAVEANLIHGAEALANMEPVLTEVAKDVMRVIRVTIEGQGRRYGGSWHALDPAYLARKVKKGLDPRILIATKKMLNAYSEFGNENQALQILPHSLFLGSHLDYPGYHEYGTSKMPARSFLEFYPQDRKRWSTMVSEYITVAMGLP
jgi:phage gpG-like protein